MTEEEPCEGASIDGLGLLEVVLGSSSCSADQDEEDDWCYASACRAFALRVRAFADEGGDDVA